MNDAVNNTVTEHLGEDGASDLDADGEICEVAQVGLILKASSMTRRDALRIRVGPSICSEFFHKWITSLPSQKTKALVELTLIRSTCEDNQ